MNRKLDGDATQRTAISTAQHSAATPTTPASMRNDGLMEARLIGTSGAAKSTFVVKPT